MEQLNTLSQQYMVDLLSENTTKYLRMISEGAPIDEIRAYQDSLDEIVKEIEARKKGENLTEMNR